MNQITCLKCQTFALQVFFKMDKYGQGVEFQFCNIMRNKGLDFNNFTRQMLLEMCIMSGCDYLPSLPGMGVKRAHGLIKRFKSYQKVGIFNFMEWWPLLVLIL